MGRVSLADLELASHDPIYQRRFEAIKEVSDMWPGWGNAMWTDTWRYLWVYTWNKAPTMPLFSIYTCLTRPIASVCHHKRALILPVRIAIHLMEDSPVSTNEESFNVIVFTKERFHAGLRFPLLSLFKQFFHFTKIPSSFIHPNAVRILMGCSILNMLYHLDLSLLESKKSFQLVWSYSVTTVGDRISKLHQGRDKRTSCRLGTWVGSYEHPTHAFEPCRSLGKRMRGQLVEWVNKTSFNRLNKLFVISVAEQDHETLLTNQNLLTLCRDSELYVVPTLPRFAPRVLVTGEHFVLKDLPFYEEARTASVKAIQDRLDKERKTPKENKPELLVPYINLEPEGEEEDMASRLKVGFKERHRNHPKAPREELALEAPIVEVGRLGQSLWEDIVALLKRVSYFTALESSTLGVHAFFPYFRRQFVELPSGGDTIHDLMRQQSSLLKWLEVVESMRVFLTQQIDNSEELMPNSIFEQERDQLKKELEELEHIRGSVKRA
ncbi:hypothetical protein AAG906_013893 [Vitis piasezkii]